MNKLLALGLLLFSGVVVGQVTIPMLPPATTPLSGSETILLQQNGISKQTPVSSISGGGGAPTNAPYALVSSTPSLTQSRVIRGTTNQVNITDSGALGNLTFSLPQSIATTSAPTFGGLTINGTSVLSGATTMGAPSGVIPLLINTGDTGPVIQANAVPNQSIGLEINAGTGLDSEVALRVDDNTTSTDYFIVSGRGSVTVGPEAGQGPGTINVTNGYYVGGVPLVGMTLADPTAFVGLTAVNGVATTAMRSDASPALDQSISPTWTGHHTFTPGAPNSIIVNSNTSNPGLILNGANFISGLQVNGSIVAGRSQGIDILAGTNNTDYAIRVKNAASSTQFWQLSGDGGQTVGTPTGGDKGLGTINATGLFVNGTAVSTTTLTVPTGLALGNGSTFSAYPGTSCTNQFPRSLNSSGVATCNSVALGTDVTGQLGAANGGTGQSSFAVGDMLYASASTTLSKLADVAAGSYLRSGGVATAPAWSNMTLPNAATTGDILYATSANVIGNLADTTTGNVLLSGGAGAAPSYGKVDLTSAVSNILPVANGGTATATPSLVAGTNVTITGTWPNQTVNSSAGGVTQTVSGAVTLTVSVGCTTTPTFNGYLTKTGNVVSLMTSSISCTANTTNLNITGIPASYQPSGRGSGLSAPVFGYIVDASTTKTSSMNFCPSSGGCTAGTVVLIPTAGVSYSGAGTITIPNQTFTYTLD